VQERGVVGERPYLTSFPAPQGSIPNEFGPLNRSCRACIRTSGVEFPQGPTGPGAKPKYLVINADEGEPGTCKDIPTMMADPHSLVEGCIITSYAIRANFCAIYIRGEALHPIRRVRHAVEEAYAAGVREMVFVTSRHKRAIEDHFDRTFEIEEALEKSNKDELLRIVRAVKPDDMECVFVRQPQALGDPGAPRLLGRHQLGAVGTQGPAAALALQPAPAVGRQEHVRTASAPALAGC